MVDWLVSKAILLGTIEETEADTYRYSYSLLIMWVLFSFALLLVGFLFGFLGPSLVLLILFIPLRQYTGGVHSKSVVTCFCITMASFTLILWLAYMGLPATLYTTLPIIVSVSAILIFIFAPQDDINKPLTKNEKKHCRKRTWQLLVLELIAIFTVYWISAESTWPYFMTAAVTWVAVNVTIKAVLNTQRNSEA